MRRVSLLFFAAIIACPILGDVSLGQPPRKHRRAPWEITPTAETLRKVDELIDEVKEVEITMSIDPVKSKLIHTRRPVVRFAITNPSVLDIVQYSPTEFELIGLRPGYTTLTIWYLPGKKAKDPAEPKEGAAAKRKPGAKESRQRPAVLRYGVKTSRQ